MPTNPLPLRKPVMSFFSRAYLAIQQRLVKAGVKNTEKITTLLSLFLAQNTNRIKEVVQSEGHEVFVQALFASENNFRGRETLYSFALKIAFNINMDFFNAVFKKYVLFLGENNPDYKNIFQALAKNNALFEDAQWRALLVYAVQSKDMVFTQVIFDINKQKDLFDTVLEEQYSFKGKEQLYPVMMQIAALFGERDLFHKACEVCVQYSHNDEVMQKNYNEALFFTLTSLKNISFSVIVADDSKNNVSENGLNAVRRDDLLKIIEYLLTKIENINYKDEWDGNTALHITMDVPDDVVSEGENRVLPWMTIRQWLLAAGADIALQNNAGETSLALAIKKGSNHALYQLLGAYVSRYSKCSDETKEPFQSVLSLLNLLLDIHVNSWAKPLGLYFDRNMNLIESIYKPMQIYFKGYFSQLINAKVNEKDIFIILDLFESFGVSEQYGGNTALGRIIINTLNTFLQNWGITNNSILAAIDSLQEFDDLNQMTACSQIIGKLTARVLMAAFQKSSVEKSKFLKIINTVDQDKNTLLHFLITAQEGVAYHNAVCTLLTEIGVDLKRQNKKGNTPLHVAVNQPYGNVYDEPHYLQIIQILVKHGADITVCNMSGESPLMLAEKMLKEDNVEIYSYLAGHSSNLQPMQSAHKILYMIPEIINGSGYESFPEAKIKRIAEYWQAALSVCRAHFNEQVVNMFIEQYRPQVVTWMEQKGLSKQEKSKMVEEWSQVFADLSLQDDSRKPDETQERKRTFQERENENIQDMSIISNEVPKKIRQQYGSFMQKPSYKQETEEAKIEHTRSLQASFQEGIQTVKKVLGGKDHCTSDDDRTPQPRL